jgi:hypothetical protein
MASQTSFRLPTDLSRALARLAKQRGVPKSQLVREALERYLATSGSEPAAPLSVRERSAPYVGMIRLPAEVPAEDSVAVRIRQHNWRD